MTARAREHDRTMIDWLKITHDDLAHLAWCLRGPTVEMKGGIPRYPYAVRDGHGTLVASGGPEPRPFLLKMSGTALRAWRAERPMDELVQHLCSQNVHCTRLDLARDTTGPWTPYRLQRFIEADRYVSKWKKKPVYHASKGNTGLTVDLGSRQSEVFLRCYDKRAEMEAAGKRCPFGRLSRWEFELKHWRATQALFEVAKLPVRVTEQGECVWPLREVHSSYLRHNLTLTVAPVDRTSKNQSRREVLSAWERFLSDARDYVLAWAHDERSPAAQAYELGTWAVRALAPTLALIDDLGGSEVLAMLVARGRQRPPSAKRKLLLESAAQTVPALRRAIMGPDAGAEPVEPLAADRPARAAPGRVGLVDSAAHGRSGPQAPGYVRPESP